MPMVVDASVTISWYLADEASATIQSILQRLGESEAIAPALWWFEIRNVLLMNERRARLDAPQTAAILAHLARLPIALDRDPACARTSPHLLRCHLSRACPAPCRAACDPGQTACRRGPHGGSAAARRGRLIAWLVRTMTSCHRLH